MVYEDVHWLDPTSRELLDLIVARVATLPVLLIITYRPDFQATWVGQPHVTSLVLNRLGRREGASVVEGIAGNSALPQEMISEIIDRTDGVPLFVEEMTKAVLEAGANVSTVSKVSLAVPATLHASLMARLDHLGPSVKEVAQIASMIGREFSYQLLFMVAGRSDRVLVNALDQLTDAGLMFGRGRPPEATYLFKHALVQDAAYGTLLRARRQKLHADLARAIEEHFPDRAETQPELIAHHLTEAGQTEPAIRAWLRAGRKSFSRSGMIEAVAQLRKGLELTGGLPEGRDRWRLELELQLALGGALFGGKGGFFWLSHLAKSMRRSVNSMKPGAALAKRWLRWKVPRKDGASPRSIALRGKSHCCRRNQIWQKQKPTWSERLRLRASSGQSPGNSELR